MINGIIKILMKKIFVTGAEGFVGQYTVNQLKKTYSIVGLSRNTPLESSNNVEYIIGELLSETDIYNILKKHKPEIILHLAGIAKTWDNNPQEVFKINLFGTLNLYSCILKLKLEQNYNPKILYVSSAEIYGKTDTTDDIREASPLFPINDYGSSKLAADRLSYQYTQNHDLNIVILRPFPHIGPGQAKGFFVPDIASQIAAIEKDSEKNELFVGNLDCVRDYLDVRDVVSAYQAIIEANISPGEVFNICSAKGVKIEWLLKHLLNLSSKKIAIKQDSTKLRSLEIPVYIGNNQKLIHLTNWKPKYSIEQTLADVLQFWREKV